jgi:hypothetical protein
VLTTEQAITDIWPRARKLLELVLNQDEQGVNSLLAPKGSAAAYYDLHGMVSLEVLLKTLFGRTQVGLTQAIPAQKDKLLFFEFVWFDPEREQDAYEPKDVVSLSMARVRKVWRVTDINPSTLSHWVTSSMARGLLTELRGKNGGTLPQSADILPLAFLAGQMKLPILAGAMQDDVERLLLPTLQMQGFGALALVKARQLWRDFAKRKPPRINENTGKLWASAVTEIMVEQAHAEVTQAAIAKLYGAPLAKLFAPIREIRTVLGINGVDERYSPILNVMVMTN